MGASAQTISSFYTTGSGAASYIIASGVPDESATGENASWDFSALTNAGTATAQVISSTTNQSSTYPGTQLVAESTGEYNGAGSSSTIDIFTTGGGTITGIDIDGVILNYSTNNATLGTFPLQYGYSNTDQVAGTYSATLSGTAYNGTFTGTCVTSVDAYGTITSSIGSVSGTLTRLKVVQNLTLNYLGFPAGTATQTIYLYYASGNATPMVRSLATNVNVPALSVDYDVNSVEIYNGVAGVNTITKNSISIAPNPTAEVLHFTGDFNNAKVAIIDATGRIVLSGNGNDLNISSLNSGVYFANVTAETGNQTVKFIKK